MSIADEADEAVPLEQRIASLVQVIESVRRGLPDPGLPSPLESVAEGLADVVRRLDRLQARRDARDSSNQWAALNRRIDELFGVLMEIQARSVAAPVLRVANDRGIFVIGHARSGTTFLADALNTSDDICCLMEPYFYRSIEIRPFAESFNAMHRGFGNPPIKGYWVPSCGGGSGRDIVSSLRSTFRYVGEKLALRQRQHDYDPDRFLEYAVEECARSPFVCIIRDPVRVTSSVIDMFEQGDFSAETIAQVVRSQLESLLMIMRIALMVPHCYVLEYEAIDERLFMSLGSALGVDLGRAMALHVAGRQRTPHAGEFESLLRRDPNIAALQQVDSRLRAMLDRQRLRIGSDQYGKCRELCEFVVHLLHGNLAPGLS